MTKVKNSVVTVVLLQLQRLLFESDGTLMLSLPQAFTGSTVLL